MPLRCLGARSSMRPSELGVRFVLCAAARRRCATMTDHVAPPQARRRRSTPSSASSSATCTASISPAARRDAPGRDGHRPRRPGAARADELKPRSREARRARASGCTATCPRPSTTSRYCREVHGMTPLSSSHEHEWLGPDVWFAHLVHLAPTEMRLLADTQTGIAHCPQSNGRLGSGIAPVPALGRPACRSRSASTARPRTRPPTCNARRTACWLMHRAGVPHRAAAKASRRAGAATVEDVVHWGTAGGAAVLGLRPRRDAGPAGRGPRRLRPRRRRATSGLHDPAIGPVASGGGAPEVRVLQRPPGRRRRRDPGTRPRRARRARPRVGARDDELKPGRCSCAAQRRS